MIDGYSKDTQVSILTEIERIKAIIFSLDAGTKLPSDVANGLSGSLLFLEAMANFGGRNKMLPWMRRLREVAFRDFYLNQSFGLFQGRTGVLWALSKLHVESGDNDDEKYAEACQFWKNISFQQIDSMASAGNFDLISGLVGVGIASLAIPGNEIASDLVLDHLLQIAKEDENGIYWLTPAEFIPNPALRSRYTEGLIDLGLAHGVPGVIAFISLYIRKRRRSPDLERILRLSLEWLSSQQQTDLQSRFSYISGQPVNSRLGWCYGDLSVSIAMLQASTALDDPKYASLAHDTVAGTLQRTWQDGGLQDFSLCHGTSGIGYVYGRFTEVFKSEEMAKAARRWSLFLLNPATLKSYIQLTESNQSLLNGLSGIGLSLAALIDGKGTFLDEILLLDFS